MKAKSLGLKLSTLGALLTVAAGPALAQVRSQTGEMLVTIGTGAVNGVYYPAGGSICRLVNQSRKTHRIRCAVEVSSGSLQNMRAVLANEMDLGIVQTDVQFAAVRGSVPFTKEGPAKALRVLFSLHAEPLTVMTRSDAAVRSFLDLRGKRVNLGEPGSGSRATMDLVMAAFGMAVSGFAGTAELSPAQTAAAMCENKIDAFVYVVGHPNAAVRSIAETCATRLVPVTGPAVEQVVKNHPYYSLAVIPGRMYVGSDLPTASLGVRASVVARESLPADVAYEFTKAVFSQLAEFRLLHPAFNELTREQMLSGNTAPLHPGALRYLKEAGLAQ